MWVLVSVSRRGTAGRAECGNMMMMMVTGFCPRSNCFCRAPARASAGSCAVSEQAPISRHRSLLKWSHQLVLGWHPEPSVSIFPVNCKYFIRSSGAVCSGDIMFMASLTISHLFIAAAAVNCSLNILIVCCWWWWTQARFLNTPTSDTDEIWTVGDFCYNQSQTINNKSFLNIM